MLSVTVVTVNIHMRKHMQKHGCEQERLVYKEKCTYIHTDYSLCISIQVPLRTLDRAEDTRVHVRMHLYTARAVGRPVHSSL